MISLSIDNASVASIVNDIRRLDAAGKKSMTEAVRWAGANICISLKARTKQSKEMRKIVTKQYHGIPVRGVNQYRAGKKIFVPIFASRTVAAIPIKTKSGHKMFLIKPETRFVNPEQFRNILGALVDNPQNLIIKMSGLAKRSWGWLNRNVRRGGNAFDTQGGRRVDVGSIIWFGNNLTIHNKLGYIQKALKGGTSAVDMAILKASRSFHKKVNDILEPLGVQAK